LADASTSNGREVIDAALDAGITFDTADIYGNRGNSERFLGELFEAAATASCWRRSSVTTWAIVQRPGRVRGPWPARPLERLRMDHVDLFYYHRPDGVTPLAETLERCRVLAQGLTRAIGCSNASPSSWRKPTAGEGERRPRFVAVQNQYSLLEREAEDDCCRRRSD
jgi:aryl-alcohol dehydrogenase-like predicted oxidoreductase